MSIENIFNGMDNSAKTEFVKDLIRTHYRRTKRINVDHRFAYHLADEFEYYTNSRSYLKENAHRIIVGEYQFFLVDSVFALDAWVVFHIEGDETLFRMNGMKDVHNGDEWDLDTLGVVNLEPVITYEYIYESTKVNE